jgi:hypothetical protein
VKAPNLPRPTSLDDVMLRRDAHDHAIRKECNSRCEDCGQSVRGLAVFECVAPRASSALYCCPSCASQELDPVRAAHSRHWARVVLVRSGLSGVRVGRFHDSGYAEVWPAGRPR